MLAARTRESSAFLTGFTRVCADGGVALYSAENVETMIQNLKTKICRIAEDPDSSF